MSVRRGISVRAVDVAVVEQAAHALLEPHVDQLDGLFGKVYANPLPTQVLGGDAGGGTAAERV